MTDVHSSSTLSREDLARVLETEGLIRIRRGKVGGAIVKRPTAESAAYHLGLTLQSRKVTLEDLASARAVLEPACAGLAAALPDKQRVAVVERLSALVDESESMLDSGSEDSTAFTTSALKFHFGIVAESGNTTIGLLAGALTAVWNAQESS